MTLDEFKRAIETDASKRANAQEQTIKYLNNVVCELKRTIDYQEACPWCKLKYR